MLTLSQIYNFYLKIYFALITFFHYILGIDEQYHNKNIFQHDSHKVQMCMKVRHNTLHEHNCIMSTTQSVGNLPDAKGKLVSRSTLTTIILAGNKKKANLFDRKNWQRWLRYPCYAIVYRSYRVYGSGIKGMKNVSVIFQPISILVRNVYIC